MRRYLLGWLLLGATALGCAKAEPKINEEPVLGGGGAGGPPSAGASGEGGGDGASGGGGGAAGSDGGASGQSGGAGSGGEAGMAGAAQGGAGQGGSAGDGGTAGTGGNQPKPCLNKPLINELMTAREAGGKVDEKYEFLELLAVGDDEVCAISLLEYKLFFNNVEIWGGSVSPGFKKGKRFVLGGESYSADGKPTDQGLPQPAFPANGGCIELRKGGSLVDQVCYGTDGQAPAPAPGQSIGRSPDGVDTDNDPNDFKILDVPTPGGKNP
ncbi:MAG: hypothetical protein RMJ98_04775 [Myxococcales bacterium]|nr:hypothetical protein [Polyangiaceae bacterium]MDW8248606.1 hypothetical protein [Myxococcales bacterium]